MFDADFRNCSLEGAQFDEIIGTCNVFSAPKGMFFGVHGVRFQGANLRKASFRRAKLAGDFTNAELNEIDFTGAELSGSLMLRSDESAVILTDEQRMGICWVEA